MSLTSLRPLLAVCVAAFVLGGPAVAVSQAALAKKLGQPISAYSASLFGKTGLNATQTQTLTCDPDGPLNGSTSVLYDAEIVHATSFGFGPGYQRWSGTSGEYPSGFAIEISDAGGRRLTDLAGYLANPVGNETGYIQSFYELFNDAITGHIPPPPGYILLDSDPSDPANPSAGVDTHFFEFEYRSEFTNANPASYTIFASDTRTDSNTAPDFMTSQDPTQPVFGPGDVESAFVSGTIGVPEPGALVAAFPALLALAFRRPRG